MDSPPLGSERPVHLFCPVGVVVRVKTMVAVFGRTMVALVDWRRLRCFRHSKRQPQSPGGLLDTIHHVIFKVAPTALGAISVFPPFKRAPPLPTKLARRRVCTARHVRLYSSTTTCNWHTSNDLDEHVVKLGLQLNNIHWKVPFVNQAATHSQDLRAEVQAHRVTREIFCRFCILRQRGLHVHIALQHLHVAQCYGCLSR